MIREDANRSVALEEGYVTEEIEEIELRTVIEEKKVQLAELELHVKRLREQAHQLEHNQRTREAEHGQKMKLGYWMLGLYVALCVCTIVLVFLDSWKGGPLQIDDGLLQWFGGAYAVQITGMLLIIVRYYYPSGGD